ncbi:hypothetical protein AALP_AA7G165700 [Arabis alpina]|uniref:ATP-dependent DNA ligase family profile domain-containing protein n=1 Tax=Arabis alpina TaxID=50452 RepID=A0A087GII5_ARAAL|nr:hypothetical protein AALP_AA7G165700 [Arabis alpina]
MLRTIIVTTPEDLIATVYLCANENQGEEELGIGKGPIVKAISEAFGKSEAEIMEKTKELGELGLVARRSRSSQAMIYKPKPLTIVKVFNTFGQIAKETGNGSKEKKQNRMKELFVATTDCESLYLTRLLQAKLRLNFTETKSPLIEAVKIVKHVFSVVPAYDTIVHALLSGEPAKSVGEILDKFQDTVFTCEYKYDGQREHIHYMEDGRFEIFSKSGKETLRSTPMLLKKPFVKSFILDCEVVAFDREKKKFLPLQILSTRARKNVNVHNIKVGVSTLAFDMLYLNGQLLIHENLNIRREKLYESFEEDPGCFQFATALTSSNVDEIQEFLEASVKDGCEDYMEDSCCSIGDSVDLVPIAAYYGEGKRAGLFGSHLLACYDGEKNEFQSICKIGTGFSEAELEDLSSSLGSKVIATAKKCYQVGDSLKPEPDVWCEPTEVWEVKAADLTISPTYLAATGIVDPNKGISLRFPRLVRVREDKTPYEATSSEQIAELFKAQKRN